jgi:hypothetical protein
MSKSWYWWKHFLLGIGLSLLIFLGQPGASRARLPVFLAKATQTNIQQHHKARSLTQAGHKQLDRGQASHALQTWQSATKIYQQLGDRVGMKGSLVNQSGFTSRRLISSRLQNSTASHRARRMDLRVGGARQFYSQKIRRISRQSTPRAIGYNRFSSWVT